MSKWERIDDVLTPEGIAKLKTGQVLLFNYEGSPLHLKVRRKVNGKVWAERIRLFTEEEIQTELEKGNSGEQAA